MMNETQGKIEKRPVEEPERDATRRRKQGTLRRNQQGARPRHARVILISLPPRNFFPNSSRDITVYTLALKPQAVTMIASVGALGGFHLSAAVPGVLKRLLLGEG
jgi:hypothetical protein